jgi:hypothetical protein
MAINLFARNGANELIRYWWADLPPGLWHHENLTTDSNVTANTPGPVIANDPVVIRNSDRFDVFARDREGNLIQYWWSEAGPGRRWQHANLTIDPALTVNAPGPTLGGDPRVQALLEGFYNINY